MYTILTDAVVGVQTVVLGHAARRDVVNDLQGVVLDFLPPQGHLHPRHGL